MEIKFLISMLCIMLSINFAEGKDAIISVETSHNALILSIDQEKHLSMIYFGSKLSNPSEYTNIAGTYRQSDDISGMMNAAYTPSGSRNVLEPALSVTHADGNNSVDLVYVSQKNEQISSDISLLTIILKDPVYNLEVILYYKSYFRDDVIEQWSRITNGEEGNIYLNKFASANLNLKSSAFWLRQYHGDWAKEMRPEESRLTRGIKTLDSKLGTRADMFQPPVFMISLGKPAGEDEGEVFFGSLEWSGNFRTDLEIDPRGDLRVIAGMNNYPSPYVLKIGESLTTPAFLFTLSAHGKGEASRNIQRWARTYKILDGQGSRQTLLNNWESTFFEFNQEKLLSLIADANKLGVDVFLLDDGWFGNKYPRDNDRSALGDWQPSNKKLPDGIARLTREAVKAGIQFGIWIEPEMVSPKSVLYEKHPDWVVKQPNRQEYYMRNQLVLDMGNPKVQNFVYNTIDSLFIINPQLAYIKWDCNSVIFNAYSSKSEDQSHFYVDYVNGLYTVLKNIRAKYPKIPIMLCSGGGGRVDYAALQFFTEFWPSDNTDPVERIFIQWEYSYFYPAIAIANHVTDWGKQPLKFRIDVAMMGKLGFDIIVNKLSPADLKFAQQSIKIYNQLKPIIFQGEQYRLSDPGENAVASTCYVSPEKTSAVVFNYLVGDRYGEQSTYPILFKGLSPDKKYSVSEINVYPGAFSALNGQQIYTGEFLMKIGFNPVLNKERTSVVLKIEAQ